MLFFVSNFSMLLLLYQLFLPLVMSIVIFKRLMIKELIVENQCNLQIIVHYSHISYCFYCKRAKLFDQFILTAQLTISFSSYSRTCILIQKISVMRSFALKSSTTVGQRDFCTIFHIRKQCQLKEMAALQKEKIFLNFVNSFSQRLSSAKSKVTIHYFVILCYDSLHFVACTITQWSQLVSVSF